MEKGKVYLVGAGPGDAELLTVKARRLIECADVVVYDALISTEILCLIPKEKETIFVGKRSGYHAVPQEEINRILLKQAEQGKCVVRLKGGDPFVFGRGGEELELLAENGIDFEVVPGITSAVAVPAYNGIPVTHRDYTSSFHVITGHPKKDGKFRIDYPALVRLAGTLIFLMGISSMEDICRGLMDAGMDKAMPAAVLERGTCAKQRKVISTVAHLKEDAEKANIQTPAIIVVGKVCELSHVFAWSEKRPLGGRQFLVTRPVQNSRGISERLRMLGAQVLEYPTVFTETISENKKLEDALCVFGNTGDEAWIVFTSPIGVQVFFEQITSGSMDIRSLASKPAALKFAVIGSGTKEKLKNYGILADLMPEIYDAENLGICLAQKAKKGSEVLIVRAENGSEALIPPLRQAELQVKDIPLYHTRYSEEKLSAPAVRAALEAGEIDGVTFTSASTVKGFVQELGDVENLGIRAICIGRQTAEAAAEAKMSVLTAETASIDSMIERIVNAY